MGEAWSNMRVTQALAARMGVEDAVFRMSEPELLRALFDGATGRVTEVDLDRLPDAGPI